MPLNTTSETSTSSHGATPCLVSASSSSTVCGLPPVNEVELATHGSRVRDSIDYVFLTYYYGLLGLITIINLTGNALVIQCLVRHRHLRIPGNYFIFSLACSDLCLGLIYPVYNVSHMEIDEVKQALSGWHFCTSIITLYLGLQSISAYSLVGVAVTRFISIRRPLRFSSIVTHFRAIVSAFLLWVLLIALSAILYFRISKSESYQGVCRYEQFLKYGHILFTCVMSVIAPLVLMTILYSLMAHEATKHVIAIAYAYGSLLGDTTGARRYIMKKELRMVAMAGTLLGYFAFSWLPFVVYQFYTIHYCSSDNWSSCEPNKYIRATVRLLLHSNSAVNFFIYSIRVKDFRDAIYKDLRRSIRCCRRRLRRADSNGVAFSPPRSRDNVQTLYVGAKQIRNTSSLGSTLTERSVCMETQMRPRCGT